MIIYQVIFETSGYEHHSYVVLATCLDEETAKMQMLVELDRYTKQKIRELISYFGEYRFHPLTPGYTLNDEAKKKIRERMKEITDDYDITEENINVNGESDSYEDIRLEKFETID